MDMLESKKDLCNFLSCELIHQAISNSKYVITSGGFLRVNDAKGSKGIVSDTLFSDQEEADTRILLHISDAKRCGFERIMVRCRDTDVLVLLIHFFSDILPTELWMCAGTKEKKRFIPVHSVVPAGIPDVLCKFLPGFHALTGCDTTSQFAGHGKTSAWKTFKETHILLTN